MSRVLFDVEDRRQHDERCDACGARSDWDLNVTWANAGTLVIYACTPCRRRMRQALKAQRREGQPPTSVTQRARTAF